MYGLCVSVLLLSAAVCTNAAVAVYLAQQKPAELANREGCYLEDLNKVIPYGDYYPEKSCVKYSCDTDNITHVFSCGAVYVDKRCGLISNEEATYPDCCPLVMCGTVPPEYFNENTEENTSSPDSEETDIEKQTGSPVLDKLNEVEESRQILEEGIKEVKSLNHEQMNELLIAQASNVEE